MFYFENGRYKKAAGYTGSLYQEGKTFTMASLKSVSYYASGQPINFILPDDLVFVNSTDEIISISVNFGDGAGLKMISTGTEVPVYYSSGGTKQLAFQVITATDTLYSNSRIVLAEVHNNQNNVLLSASGDGGLCYPDAIIPFSTSGITQCGVSEEPSTANAYIRYADSDNPVLTKPLIFVEGIDFVEADQLTIPGDGRTIRHGNFGWDVLTTGIDPKTGVPSDAFEMLPNLVNNATEQEYDVILLDFANGTGFVQQNADLLIQLIRWVNNNKTTCEQNVIAGASMGGIITRYALTTMEKEEEDHDTRLYISMDAPHQGANVPAGLQAFLRTMHDHLGFIGAAEAPLLNIQRPAAKQLLKYHIDGEYCMREALLSELNELGYPEKCRNVAIVSGSNQGEAGIQAPLPGEKYLDFTLYHSGLVIPSYLEIDIDMWAVEREDFVGEQKIGHTEFDLVPFLPFTYIEDLVNGNGDHYITPSQFGALDSTPGGHRSTIEDELIPQIDQIRFYFTWGRPISVNQLSFHPTHSFIPSISAIDVNTEDLFFDLRLIDDENSQPVLTPFDAYYSQVANLSHVEISQGVIDWTGTELPKSEIGLLNILSETYNYGHIVTLIPDVTITQTGILRINDNGSTGYLNDAEAEEEFFHVYTHAACDADITVQDGGQFILGSETAPYRHGIVHVEADSTVYVESGGTLEVKRNSDLILERGAHLELSGLLRAEWGGQVIIKDGASLRVADGGTLRMIHYSNVIVEDGGQLIIEEGATINLWDNVNHHAHISVFGELVINGQLSIGGSGYFKFNEGNQLTFGPDVSEFSFTGNAQDHRFFLIKENATLDFGDIPFTLTNGIIAYEAGSTIHVEKAPYVRFLGMNLNGLEEGATAITADGVDEISLRYCGFLNLQTGLRSINDATGTVFLQGCDFKLCRFGLFSIGHEQVSMYSSNFSGEGLEKAMAAFLVGNQNVTMTNTDILNYSGSAYQNDYDAAISLGSDEGITNLSMYGCLVQNNYIGITTAEGNNSYSDGNIFVRNRTTFQDNETGIFMARGRHHELNAGLVLLDCARLIDNQVGIRGTDVLLQVDSEENCLECGDHPETQIRPNTLVAPWMFDSYVNIFDICYQNFQVDEIPAKGNYWTNGSPSGQMWRFKENAICSGFIPDNILDASNPISSPPSDCPDETVDDGCPSGQVCVVNPPDDKQVIVEIEGHNYNVHSQYAAAYQDFRNEKFSRSKERFMPTAGIPDEVKKNLNGVGKHYIDVARVMVNALQGAHQDEHIAGQNSEENYNDTYGHLWLTGTKQKTKHNITNGVNFTVSPNPASNQVMVEAIPGAYELSVYNILGNLIYRTRIEHRINLEVAEWDRGIYTIELKDESNIDITKVKKLIIQ